MSALEIEKNREPVPLYIMEEHNEAFYYWNYFISKGLIPRTGNYLLHVDHHDDMEGGGYDWDFSKMPETLEEIKEFTYRKLGIADFILPAVYQGIFSRVHILKNLLPRPVQCADRYVKCLGNSELIGGNVIPFVHNEYKGKADSPYRFYEEIRGGLADMPKVEESLILDVDLDYFAWDDSLSTVPLKKLEITKESYEAVQKDPWNPFRILPRRLLDVRCIEDRYYLVYEEHTAPKSCPSKERMIQRMERFLEWFEKSGIRPLAVTICRSRYSGYLHNEAFPWIEDEFIKRLSQKMEIKKEIAGE